MWCGTCGRAVEAGALFCGGCGAKLAPAAPAVTVTTSAVGEEQPQQRTEEPPPAAVALPEVDGAPPPPPQQPQNGYAAGSNGTNGTAVPPPAPPYAAGQQQQGQYHYAPPQPPYQQQQQHQYAPPNSPHGAHAYGGPYQQAPPPPGPNGGLFAQVGERVSRMTGVGPVEGFDARELFSAAFQKRAEEDVEEYFLVGTQSTTPPITSVKAVWPKPWVFYKVFVAAVTVFFGFLTAWSLFQNLNVLPGLWIVGSFVIPLSVVIFYFEMNVAKNVSLYQVAKMLTLGGALSIIASLIGFQSTNLSAMFGAMAAGPIEEAGKLAALLLIVKSQRYPWTLNGLLFGGAVGAGFAGFESAGYALNVMMKGGDTAMMWNMFLRGLLSPGGHVAWTALVGAALWRVKGSAPFHTGMLTDPRFFRVLLFAMGLHVLWNSPLFAGGLFGIAKCVVLGVVAWAAVLAFVQDGIKQVQQAQAAAKEGDGGAHAAAVDAAASEFATSGRLVLSGPLLPAYPAQYPQQVSPPHLQQQPPPAPVG